MSTDSQWEGPVNILRNNPPSTEPPTLSPAQLDSTILHDTLLALRNLDGCEELQQSFLDLIQRFNEPLTNDLLAHPFVWVYNYMLPAEEPLPTNLVTALSVRIHVHGHTSLELTPVLPDVGAIVALAAPGDDPYWLGLVTRLTRTKVFVRWLEKDTLGAWHVSTTHEEGQLLSTLIAHDVSLSVLDATMRPELHQRLMHARQQWDEHPSNST